MLFITKSLLGCHFIDVPINFLEKENIDELVMQIFWSKHNSSHMTWGYYQHLVGYVSSCVL
jgi:hypothetical protein